jgi:hypothetical protein
MQGWHIELKTGSDYANIEEESYYLGKYFIQLGMPRVVVITQWPAGSHQAAEPRIMQLPLPYADEVEKVVYCAWIAHPQVI